MPLRGAGSSLHEPPECVGGESDGEKRENLNPAGWRAISAKEPAVSACAGARPLELRDVGEGTPHCFNRGREAVGGRGLQIVDVLARNWGVESRAGGRGKSTWFIVSG